MGRGRARGLRRRQTDCERVLWRQLRARRLQHQARRQSVARSAPEVLDPTPWQSYPRSQSSRSAHRARFERPSAVWS
ncbi:MAG: DUF559 domain-containing protein [Candidatus Methylomirabilis oxyfera]|nr:DUF559 domain-containing protein [Candidatus Methylomirabilis oxyfera]